MSLRFVNQSGGRVLTLCFCLGLLLMGLSAQAQEADSLETPATIDVTTPAITETAVIVEALTTVQTALPPIDTTLTEPAIIPTAEVSPVAGEPTVAATEAVTAVATVEITTLPTEAVTSVPSDPETTPIETVTPVAFSANFDAAYPPELSASMGWIVVQVANGQALQSDTGAVAVHYTAATLTDAAVEARFLLNAGEGQVLLRGYSAGLNANGSVTLYHDGAVVTGSTVTLTPGEWNTLRLQILSTNVQISVNNSVVIAYTDEALIEAGMAGFAAGGEAVVRVDDFAVYGIGTAIIPADNTPLPTEAPVIVITEVPTVTETPVVIEEATQEVIATEEVVVTAEATEEAALPEISVMSLDLNLPTNVAAAGNGTSVNLTWTDTNTDETGYQIQRYVSDAFADSVIGSTAANAQAFTEANVGCGLTLWYRVRAVRSTDSAVSGWSDWMSVTTAPCTATCNSGDAVKRVSVGSSLTYQTSGVISPLSRALSAVGDKVLFGSLNPLEVATGELSGENNVPGMADVYERNMLTCEVVKVSVGSAAEESALSATPGAISPDGIMLVFDTASNGLTPEDMDSVTSVFLRQSNTLLRLLPVGYRPAPGHIKVLDLHYPYVLMLASSELTGTYGLEDYNDMPDLILYNVETSTSQPIKDGIDTPHGGAFGGRIVVTETGTVYVLVNSLTSMWLQNDSNNVADVFLNNPTTQINTRISVTDTEGQFSNASLLSGFLLDGDTLQVTFETASLENGAASGLSQVFLRTVSLTSPNLGTTTLVSRATGAAGAAGTGASTGGRLSGDGRWVVFTSAASNLVSGDTNNVADAFVRDLTSNTTVRVSKSNLGAQLTSASSAVDISADGKTILFSSADSTIVPDDTANVCETDMADSNPALAGTQYDYNDNCIDLFTTSNPLTFTATPTGLTASTTFNDKIRLTWLPVSSVQGFTVEWSFDNGLSWGMAATVSNGSATSYDLPVACSVSLKLRLRSFVAAFNSSPSTGVSGKTIACAGPVLESPAKGAFLNTSTPSLSWSKPHPEIYGYDLDLSTTPTFATHVAGYPTNAVTEGYATGTLPEGTYYWRVRTNAPGIGSYSAVSSFTVDTIVPAAPVITAPEQLAQLNTPALLITWGAVTGAKTYSLVLHNGVGEIVAVTNLTTPTYNLSSGLAQGQYTLTVRATDAAGNESPASSITFTLKPMLTPAHNSFVAMPTGSASGDVTFTWKGIGAAGAHNYTAQLFSDESLSTLLNECTSTGFTCKIPGVPGGTYYWRVLRDSEQSNIGIPVTNKFVVTPPLTAPTLRSPGNNAIVMPDQRNNSAVILAWNNLITTDPDPDYIYEVEVNASSTFAIEPAFTTSNVVFQAVLTSALPDGIYYWRVRGTNTLGAVSAWSSTFKFVLDTVKPAAPVIVTPAQSAVLQTSRPTFTWTGPTDAVRYEVDINDTCDDGTPLYSTGATVLTRTFMLPAGYALAQGTQQVCVRGYDAAMNPGDFSAVRTITVFLGIAPANNAFIPAATKPTFTWTATPGAPNLTLIYDTDTDFSSGATELAVTGTSKTLTSTLPAGVYYWRVLPVGNTPLGNPYRTLYVGSLLAAPSPVIPANNTLFGASSPTIDLTWTDVNPAPLAGLDITDYEVVISKSAAFTPALVLTTVIEGAQQYTWTPPASQNRVPFYWRVRALSNGVPVSNWSAIRSVVVDNVTPTYPATFTPTFGAVVNTVRPVFTWSAVTGATGYMVTLTDLTTSTDIVANVAVTTTNYTAPVNLPQHNLQLRVQATDGVNTGAFNGVLFSVKLGTLPATTPGVTTSRPLFTWTVVPGTGVKYTLEVASNADFSSMVFSQSNLAAASYTPTQAQALPSGGVYYWRVNHDGVNSGFPADNKARAFTYIVTGKPSNLAAHAGGTSGAVKTKFNMAESMPIGLTWDPPASPAVPLSYEIQVASNAAFTTGLFAMDTGTDTSGLVSPPLINDGLLYWRVKAIYTSDATSFVYSDTKTFMLDATPLAAPVQLLPGFGTVSSNPRPTFTWKPVAGAVRYHFSLYTYIASTQTLTAVPGYEDVALTGTSYTIPATAAPLAQRAPASSAEYRYSWIVRAEDTAGNLSVIGTPATYRSLFIRLMTSAGVLDTTPTLSWTAISGAGSSTAQVQIATDQAMSSIVYTSPLLPEPVSSFTVPDVDALAEGGYYWRVLRTGDNPDHVNGSFIVLVNAPASFIPVLTGPANGTVLGTPQLQSSPLTWNDITPPSFGAGSFVFSIGKQSNPSQFAGLNLHSATSAGTEVEGRCEGVCYWQISYNSMYGNLGTSVARMVVVDTTPPSVPVMNLPVTSAVITNTRRPTFTWAVSTGNPVQYMLEISSMSNFSSIVYTATLAPATLSHALPASKALANGTYYWRVRAKDATGNLSNTPARQFRIAMP